MALNIQNIAKSGENRKTLAQSTFKKTSSKISGSKKAANIWRSRISWRITLAVFLTIMAVQATILTLTMGQKEQQILNEIREVGRSAIAPLLGQTTSFLDSPITLEKANRVLSSTIVNGFVIYSTDLKNLLATHGEPVSMVMLDQESLSRTHISSDGSSYEVVYRPNDLNRPYIIVARLNSDNLNTDRLSNVQQTILIMRLMSAFVTTVLMIALGYWLLEPILFMRDNLMKASQNPENPKIPDSPFSTADEIGSTIMLAQKLIHQNAESMVQVKSAAEDKIHKLAYFDRLTGLPNRTLFIQKFTEMAFNAGPNESPRIAVITMDLDHFKDINDSMGHNVGDAILRGVGKRLSASMPESAVVARSGEDEFSVCMRLNSEINTARDVAEKVTSIVKEEPFKVFNENFQVRTSVGVSTFPDDGSDPNDILKHADIALNRAKEEGRDRFKEYTEDFDKAVQARFQLLRDLRDALENDDLTIFYQPQFDLNSGQIIGAEALIRWFKKDDSKEGGTFISPAEFIPIAEQSGLIVPIGEWVLENACKTAKTWHEKGQNIRIAVNVSGAQFYQSDMVGHTKKVLKETGVEPHLVELEVTESVFMDDITIAINTLKELHELGVELAIDDFGTGYSSLSYLRQFNIDRLKIDQSFIRNALTNDDDAAIARTIVKLGHSLNLKVIAEGVETKEHEEFLKKEDCDEVQGFRYSKPVPQDEFWAFAEKYDGDLSSFDS
ncbi:MAG: EAL domain-containing protein [Pseudomonadota bacterium]